MHKGKDGRIAWAEKHCLADREDVVGTIISPASPWLVKCRWFLMRHLRRRSAHVGINERGEKLVRDRLVHDELAMVP